MLLLCCIVLPVYAQKISSGGLQHTKKDSIAKEIVDNAEYIVTYKYKYTRDPQKPNRKRNGLTMLQIGNRYNRFWDYYQMRWDSLVDGNSRGEISDMDAFNAAMASGKKKTLEENILIDKIKNNEIVQRTAGSTQKYQYEEPCPELNWEILEGDTIIAGYKCNKAKTSLFGRDYIAWYSPEINLPYGPYKFSGLPGLIFRVTDTNNHFDFLLDGFEKTDRFTPIYLWKKDIENASRDKVRKIYKNYCADPLSAFKGNDAVTLPENSKMNVKSRPYYPIELE